MSFPGERDTEQCLKMKSSMG